MLEIFKGKTFCPEHRTNVIYPLKMLDIGKQPQGYLNHFLSLRNKRVFWMFEIYLVIKILMETKFDKIII